MEGSQYRVPDDAIVVRGGTLIDGTGAAPRTTMSIVIRGERIVAVGPDSHFLPSSDTTTIDAAGMYVLPGLINAHVHYTPDFRNPPQDWAEAGVTTLVDVGGASVGTLTAREALREYAQPVPQLLVAGSILLVDGATHTERWGEAGFYQITSDADARAAAHASVGDEVDLLKVALNPSRSGARLSEAEVCAIVDEAHRGGRRVMSHVESEADVVVSVNCGVDILTHMPSVGASTVDLIVARGTSVVPTLNIYGGDARSTQEVRDLRARGVLVGCGDDFPNGVSRATPMEEIRFLEATGMSRMDVIRAATSINARILGVDGGVGTLEPGKVANLLILRENPLDDLRHLTAIENVISRGIRLR